MILTRTCVYTYIALSILFQVDKDGAQRKMIAGPDLPLVPNMH